MQYEKHVLSQYRSRFKQILYVHVCNIVCARCTEREREKKNKQQSIKTINSYATIFFFLLFCAILNGHFSPRSRIHKLLRVPYLIFYALICRHKFLLLIIAANSFKGMSTESWGKPFFMLLPLLYMHIRCTSRLPWIYACPFSFLRTFQKNWIFA